MNRVKTATGKLLTIYTISTAALFLGAFLVLNAALKDYVEDSPRRELKSKVQAMKRAYLTGGLKSLKDMAKEELLRTGKNKFFVLVRNASGKNLLSLGGEGWTGLNPWEKAEKILKSRDKGFFVKKALKKHHWPWGFYVRRTGDGTVIMAGTSLKQEKVLSDHIKETVVLSFLILSVTTITAGIFLSKKNLERAVRISSAATKIQESGDLSKRIPESEENDEIGLIASSFNRMLDGLEKALKSVKETMDALSHDIRTPLSRISSACQLGLSKNRSPDEYREILQDVLEDTDQLLKLLELELDISEAEAGTLPLKMEEIDLSSLVLSCVDTMEPLAMERGISVRFEIKEGVRLVCDGRKIFQATSNLIDNAIKFNKRGGTVTVRLEESPDNVAITVEDTGIGIDESDTERIFERFYRSDPSRSSPGYGLGLTLVKAVASSHGGHVKVKSEKRKEKGKHFYHVYSQKKLHALNATENNQNNTYFFREITA